MVLFEYYGVVAEVSSISGGQGPRAADCAPAYKYKTQIYIGKHKCNWSKGRNMKK